MNSWTVSVAMFGWIPLVAIIFATLPPPRAVLASFLVGWLFLPIATFPMPGLPDYSKATAVPLVIFLAIAVFDPRRLQAFTLRAIDLPMAVFCVLPMVTSLTNNLGWYDAIASLISQVLTWGLPYLTGRLYCSSPEGLKRLSVCIVLGGLVYAPLCLWEIRMSPQLHNWVYGHHQHDWTQVLRGAGYRPAVFMNHGLMVALWLTAASLVGFALWSGNVVQRILGVQLRFLVPGLFIVAVLCKSLGALVLLLAGTLVLLGMRTLRLSLPMALVLVIPTGYVGARIAFGWSGAELTTLAESVDTERSDSLSFRLDAEERLVVKAMQKPLFGWGGWGRSFVPVVADAPYSEHVTTDSLWIITVGKYGLVGLGSVLLVFLVPVIVLWRRCPPRLWASHPWATVSWALAMVLSLYAIDNLANDMENPIYLLIAGGLSGLSAGGSWSSRRAARRRQAAVPAAVLAPRVPAPRWPAS